MLNDIEPVSTAHQTGEKSVFLTQQDTHTALTQFAFGKLMPGEEVETHLHPTMEEYFYFISGFGVYMIDEGLYNIQPSSFVHIPANTLHSLKTTGNESLTFVYFGIALNK
ncbi:MAG: cupin domain-containing protein [Bacteroidetes bacterium]|nr:cupin domain-containing protein [Bacteroidota bacterium]